MVVNFNAFVCHMARATQKQLNSSTCAGLKHILICAGTKECLWPLRADSESRRRHEAGFDSLDLGRFQRMTALMVDSFGYFALVVFEERHLRIHHLPKKLSAGLGENLEARLAGELGVEVLAFFGHGHDRHAVVVAADQSVKGVWRNARVNLLGGARVELLAEINLGDQMGQLARIGTSSARLRVGEDGNSEVLAREPHDEAAETVESAAVGNLLRAPRMGAGPPVTVAVA